jgi:inner membrane protein
VLGAGVGEWVLGKRLGNRALAWGALAGVLPDLLELLVSLFLDTAANLWWINGPCHSLVVMGVLTWASSRGLVKLWKKDKITQGTAAWFLIAVWATHVLIACFAVGGTAVFWPFPVRSVAFNMMGPIDPLFTLPMVVALVRLAFLRTKKQLPQRRRVNAWGFGLAAGYAGFCVAMKFLASAGFDADLARRGVKCQRRMEAPVPYNILLWRSVVDRGDDFLVGYRSVFERHATPVRWTVYPKEAEALRGLENMREVRNLMDFTGTWWVARTHVHGAWLGDMRFSEERIWGEKKGMVDSRLPMAWDITTDARGDKLRHLVPTRTDSFAMFGRCVSRTFGKREAWEANPRLAGLTGKLPEFLAVEE